MKGAAKMAVAAMVTVGVLAVPTRSAAQSASAPRSPANGPTFHKDVEPILQRSCQQCHHPGTFAPMSLVTYEEVRPWARSIKAKISTRAMPPWGVDPNICYQRFRDDPSLTDAEIATIVKWVDGDARQGDPAQLPPLPKFAEGWQLGTPDVVFEMPVDFKIPADGTVDYQYFEVPTNFKEDRWVTAAQIR